MKCSDESSSGVGQEQGPVLCTSDFSSVERVGSDSFPRGNPWQRLASGTAGPCAQPEGLALLT